MFLKKLRYDGRQWDFMERRSRMLRKNQCRWCYFMMFILLIVGMYTTYVKAESFAERAASIEAARSYATDIETLSVTQLSETNREIVQAEVCVMENVNPLLRTVIGRINNRINGVRRELRFAGIVLWALCIAYFILRCFHIEEILCLHVKKYRVALIKYIHDIDGKKRISCLA